MASAESRKRARADNDDDDDDDGLLPSSSSKKIKTGRKNTVEQQFYCRYWPPKVWDKLSRVPLARISLRELDRRNKTQLAPRPAPAVRTADLARFARHGGPDLRHLRGYPDPQGAVYTMGPPSGVSTKTPKTSAYNGAFEQLMVDYCIYPPFYTFPDDPDAETPEPNNLEEEREVLSKRRPSLDSSRFTKKEFRIFQRKNKAAITEATVERTVVPLITGTSDDNIRNLSNLLFSDLEPIAGEDVVTPKPDFFDGADMGAIHPKIRSANEDGNLRKLIIPTNNVDAPVLPNFFMELKRPDGHSRVAWRQAMHVGAVGARAMHALMNYGKEEPVYDGNMYTYSSTYHDGRLNLYAHHVAPPTAPSDRPKYYMTAVKSYVLESDMDSFRQGVTAFRNARHRARWHRDNFIRAANAKACQSDGAVVAAPPEAGSTAAAVGVTAQSGEATAETTTAAAGMAEQHKESTVDDDLRGRDTDAESQSTITSIGVEENYTASQDLVDGEPAHSQRLLHQEPEPSQESTLRGIEPLTSLATSLTSSLSQSQSSTSGSAKRTRVFADLLSNTGGKKQDGEIKRVRRGSF